MNWTEERIALLKKLWAEGYSASRIGKELGVSKNAVVGKAHRIKLPPRPSPIKRQPTKRAKGKSTPPQPEALTQEAPASSSVAGNKTAQANQKPVVAKTAKTPKKPAKAPTRHKVPVIKPVAKTVKTPKAGSVRAAVKTSDVKNGAEKKSAATKAEEGQDAIEAADFRLFSGVTATPRKSRGPKCLWPIGDPDDPDFHFCEAPSVHGKPYCAEHCARAYITRTRGESTETDEEEVVNSADDGPDSGDHSTHEATS